MLRDLAEIHKPISHLFAREGSEPESETFRLSDEQVLQYQRDGFLAGVRILNDPQLEALKSDLEDLMQPDSGQELWYEYHLNESSDPNTTLFHALGAWRIRESYHDLLWNPAFTIPASQLLNGPVRFWHDQLFCKPARHGGVVAWHQDYSYWTRTVPMAHLTCWIGLDDSTADNGCLHYVPGSHRWPLLPITGLAADMAAIREALDDHQWQQFQNAKPVELRAGECSFHHPMMVHGSFENRTECPRRATVINAVRDGVRSATGEPLLANIPAISQGDELGGRFFPLLMPTAAV